MKKFLIAALALAAGFAAQAQAQPAEPAETEGYVFTDTVSIPTTSVKDQSRSGTCWCFSTLSFLENEIIKAGGGEYDLSEMWVVRNIYYEKALKYVRLHGALNFAVGGGSYDVIHAIKQYGIVPEQVYTGLNYGTEKPFFNEIDAVLKAYVDVIVRNPNKTLTTAWQAGLNAILDAYFGAMPETFTYEGKEYTPRTFAESLPIDMDDYVSITSFTHHPYYSQFVLEVPDNWLWASSYNITLEELMSVCDYALDNGYSIEWATDVSEKGFSRTKAVGIVPDVDVESLGGTDAARWGGLTQAEKDALLYKFDRPGKELDITPEMRQQAFDNYETTDDHGMVITGKAHDQNGTEYFKVKNSWGVRTPYDGYYYFSRPFVEYKTMSLLLNKNALPKEISKKLGIK